MWVTLRSIPLPSQPSWTLQLDTVGDTVGALSGTLLGTQTLHSLPFIFAPPVRTQPLWVGSWGPVAGWALLGQRRRCTATCPRGGGREEGPEAPWALGSFSLVPDPAGLGALGLKICHWRKLGT